MKLYTKTAFRKVPPLYATENQSNEDKVAYVKIFSIVSDHRFYIIEYDPATSTAFVLTTNYDICEFGYINLNELQEINDNFRQYNYRCPPFEREIHGTPEEGYNIASIIKERAQWHGIDVVQV